VLHVEAACGGPYVQVRAPFEKDVSCLQVPYLTLQPLVAQAELIEVLTYRSSTVPRTCGLSFARNCNKSDRCMGLVAAMPAQHVMKTLPLRLMTLQGVQNFPSLL